MIQLRSNIPIFLITIAFTTACNKDLTGTRGGFGPDVPGTGQAVQLTTKTTQTNVTCTVTPSKSIADANESVDLNFLANGGTSPYTLNGYGQFLNILTISGSFANDSDSDRAVNRSVTIYDSKGNTAICNIQLTIRGQGQSPTNAPSISLLANTLSAKPGEQIQVTAIVNGFDSSSQPVLQIKIPDQNISSSQSGNTFTLTATDNQSHAFLITVTATQAYGSANLTAEASLALKFVYATSSPLQCVITNLQAKLLTIFTPIVSAINRNTGSICFSKLSGDISLSISSTPMSGTFRDLGYHSIQVSGAAVPSTGELCNGDGIVNAVINVLQ